MKDTVTCPLVCFSRRRFILLSLAAACGANPVFAAGPSGVRRDFDAGPASDYAAEGLYTRHVDEGFFVIRHGGKLLVLSSICPHKKNRLTAEADHTFTCDAHGSTFDPNGKVTLGPAKRDMQVLEFETNKQGHLVVKIPV